MFIGGSAGNMREIIALALEKNPRVRIVATAIALESAAALTGILGDETFAFSDCEVTQLTVARGRRAGPYHLLTGQNPIQIFTMQGRGGRSDVDPRRHRRRLRRRPAAGGSARRPAPHRRHRQADRRAGKLLRRVFSKTKAGEIAAGAVLWLLVAAVSAAVPALLLRLCGRVSPWLRFALESVMCWQILAVKGLRTEAMRVHDTLETGTLAAARSAVGRIVGRDTERLDAPGVARAAIETVAENTSDCVVAPLLFLALGGAPLGFFYKAVNTMDSMLGYVEPPYKNIGLVPARMDDLMNLIPARLSALLMLLAGALLRMDVQNGWKIFRRDRYRHASPNSAQTESVCAGLLGIRLAGDAWYHGALHKKEYIGDALREVENADIPRTCRLMLATSALALVVCCALCALFSL